MSFPSSFSTSPPEDELIYIPSSFFVSPFQSQQYYEQVPLLANLGSFSRWDYPNPNVPTLPFALQQSGVEMPPHQYQPHLSTVDYNPLPTQQFVNQIDATQQMAPLAFAEAANGQFVPPDMHHALENTTTGGPIRKSTSTRRQRKAPYARPPTPAPSQASSSQLSTPMTEFVSLSVVQRRLAVQGVCRIQGCGQTFASAKVYQDHVQIFHDVKRGKNGDQILSCPWDGCGELKTEASLWHHILGHNVRGACPICDREFKGDRRDSVKRHIKKCKARTGDSDERSEGYIYFDEGL